MKTLEIKHALGRLGALRTELVELAYELECRGRYDAADVAVRTSGQIGALEDELALGSAPGANENDDRA